MSAVLSAVTRKSRQWISAGVASLLVLVPSATGQTADGRVDLRPKFESGQSVHLHMSVTNSSTPATPDLKPAKKPGPRAEADPDAPQPMQSAIELGLTMKVRSVSPQHESTVDMTFDSLKVSTKTGDEKVEFDSAKPTTSQDDVVGLLMRPLVGTTVTLRVDSAGNVTSVTGGEAFTALGQFVGGGGDAGGLFGPIFSPQHGTGLVHLGESWENADKLSSPMLGEFKMTTRHTLRSVQGKDAKLDLSGRIEPATESGDKSFQIKESRFGGHYTWDLGMGMVKQLDSTMSITLEQTVAGQRTTTRSESVMHVTRTK